MNRLLALLTIAIGLGIVALQPAAGESNADPHAAARREFIAALEQAKHGVPMPPAGDGEALQICCGAFNMAVGDLVPLATLGTVMPNGM